MLKILVNSLFFLQSIHCICSINQIIYQNTLISLNNSANLDIFFINVFIFITFPLFNLYNILILYLNKCIFKLYTEMYTFILYLQLNV